MDSYDKFVKRHCCKLSDAEALKSGFHTKGQLKNSLYMYDSPGLQRDFALIKRTFTELAVTVLNPELEFLPPTAVNLPTNYAHRPQPLIAPVTLTIAQQEEIEGEIAQTELEVEKLAEFQQEFEVLKKGKRESSVPGTPQFPTPRETFLEKQIAELKDKVERDKVTQKVLVEREMDALEDESKALDSAQKEQKRASQAEETAVRSMAVSKINKYIEDNWWGSLNRKNDIIPRAQGGLTKSGLLAKPKEQKLEYLFNVLDVTLSDLYQRTQGIDEVVAGGSPGAGPSRTEEEESTLQRFLRDNRDPGKKLDFPEEPPPPPQELQRTRSIPIEVVVEEED